MTELRVPGSPKRGLRGRVKGPGDKSISHRSLLLAALAEGSSRITGLSSGSDVAHTARGGQSMGAELGHHADQVGVVGGLGRLPQPEAVIDVGTAAAGRREPAGWRTAPTWLIALLT